MWRMSVTSSAGQRTKANGVDAYDSGDDWEIGLGDLIIDLEADLEKDRRKSEMNRILTVKSPAEDLPFGVAAESTSTGFDGLVSPTANFCTEVRRFKEKRRNSCASDGGDRLRSLEPPPRAVPKVCIAKRREAQGRPGEVFEMNSSDANALCAKGKEGKRGKHQSKGLKKEKDCVRTRKEKHGEGFEFENARSFGRTEESACYCANGGTAVMDRDEMDAKGIRASAFVVDEDGGSCEREPNHKTVRLPAILVSLLSLRQSPIVQHEWRLFVDSHRQTLGFRFVQSVTSHPRLLMSVIDNSITPADIRPNM